MNNTDLKAKALEISCRHPFKTDIPVANPKDVIGNTKLPLSLVPATAMAWESLALLDGATKYGYWNWRIAGIRASVYVDATMRHLEKWNNSENCDSDSALIHLAHARATIGIIIDAAACGKLIDDRAPAMDIGAYFDKLTPHVARIKLKNADKLPRHFTGADSEPVVGQSTLE